jgi:hypothetical protein
VSENEKARERLREGHVRRLALAPRHKWDELALMHLLMAERAEQREIASEKLAHEEGGAARRVLVVVTTTNRHNAVHVQVRHATASLTVPTEQIADLRETPLSPKTLTKCHISCQRV